MALYLEEVDAIRRALGLEHVHILGHSWGGMLTIEYALTRPVGLASLILADTAASSPHWATEMRRLVAELLPEVQQTIQVHEVAGTTDSLEYQEACRIFFRRHGSGRIDPRPDYLNRMADKPGDEVYHIMWGPSEFFMTGTLKDWDITCRLGEIRAPTLVIGADMTMRPHHHGDSASRHTRFRMRHLREQRTFPSHRGDRTLFEGARSILEPC